MGISRAEFQAGCAMSVYNTAAEGDEVVLQHGAENLPRTTSNGASISASVPAEQNSTFGRSIRESGWMFLSRAGANRPLRPVARRLRLHHRRRPAILENQEAAATDEELSRGGTSASNIITSSMIRNWALAASKAVESGAAEIVTTQGAQKWSMGAMLDGAFIFLGSIEMADYPVGSTIWHQGEPFLKSPGGSTRETLPSASDMASESVWARIRYMGWLICGLLVAGRALWWDGNDYPTHERGERRLV